MSNEEIIDKFLYVGRNRRDDGQRTPEPLNRLVIGSKGIGKLAGFGVASRILITTWKSGYQSRFSLDKFTFEELETISEFPIDIHVSETKRDNGTSIRLTELNEDLHLPSSDVIRRYLFKSLPQKPNFRVFVNGIECTAETVHGDRYEIYEEIPDLGPVKGYYIVANARQPDPGLAIRVRGRIVTSPSMFGVTSRSHGFFTAEKIVGEINAEFLDPENGSGRLTEFINTSRDGFIEDAPEIRRLNEWARTYIERIIRGIANDQIQIRTQRLLKEPAIESRLQDMPPHVRGTATRVIQSIVPKLQNVDEEDTPELVEWIVRYYESNILKELMQAIIAADPEETENLANLIRDWGLKQVNSIASIITTQIQIINKLEELMSSDKSKEIEVHKLIERNLWLVREGLELWSSDKPLKQVLDNHIDNLYKDRQRIRPDLICRSRNDGREAVILEFKKPSELVVMNHVTQALEYESIISRHRPGINFTTYIVGREYHNSVLASRDKLANAQLNLWSFAEILQRARMRFEQILEILGR